MAPRDTTTAAATDSEASTGMHVVCTPAVETTWPSCPVLLDYGVRAVWRWKETGRHDTHTHTHMFTHTQSEIRTLRIIPRRYSPTHLPRHMCVPHLRCVSFCSRFTHAVHPLEARFQPSSTCGTHDVGGHGSKPGSAWERFHARINDTADSFFYCLGYWVATHPKRTLFVSVVLVIACCFGFANFRIEADCESLGCLKDGKLRLLAACKYLN